MGFGYVFLSCLCGSELEANFNLDAKDFLSCLCGSERVALRLCAVNSFSKLPVRQ